eukprot:TRINITY_DN2957_c0_g2_i1.p1 TRINITY_DN2957_c0_g2~~TRINITY_DN2957_c0_g2_i1.p1  ORF type:complete len:68 (-),score=12.78 TRINITY_DN2957_c0_g2_i1:35-238(-)
MEDIRVADHFPSVRKQCKEQAAKFFHCFSQEGQQVNAVDIDAGKRGLSKCVVQMKSYDDCMKKYSPK